MKVIGDRAGVIAVLFALTVGIAGCTTAPNAEPVTTPETTPVAAGSTAGLCELVEAHYSGLEMFAIVAASSSVRGAATNVPEASVLWNEMYASDRVSERARGVGLALQDVEPFPDEDLAAMWGGFVDDLSTECGVELAVAAATEPILADQWVDDDGYSFAFTLNTATVTATKDVANAKPGKANISWTVITSGGFENLTPERNAPPPTVVAEPAWSSSSVVCAGQTSGTRPSLIDHCTLTSMPMAMLPVDDIPAGRTAVKDSTHQSYIAMEVDEAIADEFVAALQSPEGWVVGRDSGEGLLKGCLIQTGGWWVSQATFDTGC
jgi:hypothetical protein